MEILETFIFTKALKNLNISDNDYRELQYQLVVEPDQGDLIQDTGGARKLRMKGQGRGKRGGFRVIYYWKRQTQQIFMLLIYPKGKQDDLTSEQRKLLKGIIKEF
jgi:mRNA-degrading endonuclease RelE of RelBE toxin-antitoxin system